MVLAIQWKINNVSIKRVVDLVSIAEWLMFNFLEEFIDLEYSNDAVI